MEDDEEEEFATRARHGRRRSNSILIYPANFLTEEGTYRIFVYPFICTIYRREVVLSGWVYDFVEQSGKVFLNRD